MTNLLKTLGDLYHHLNVELTDPRTRDHFIIRTPFPIIFILIFYHLFVRRIGPYLMRNRKPFHLKTVILYYNILQILACLYIFILASRIVFGWGSKFSLICEPVDWEDNAVSKEVIRGIWLYLLTKLADLLDTVFFVLRKKHSKVSFLHLYHHTGMVMLTWGCLKWLPGGHDLIIGYLNTFVHIFMYLYYTLALIHSKRYSWMKKYITQLQMGQFLANIIHSLLPLFQPNCTYPKWITIVTVPQNAFMLILFFDFYRKEYLKKKEDQKMPEEKKSVHVE